MNVLLTRSDIFNQRLAQQLPSHCKATSFPCLLIAKSKQQLPLDAVQKKLTLVKSVIFTSPTAVQWAKLMYPILNLSHTSCYVIGKGSAQAVLREFQQQATFPSQANSDALIQYLANEKLEMAPVLIFTGEAGNRNLEDYFHTENIAFEVIYTHRRKCPNYDVINWSAQSITVSVCCSAETLSYFQQLISRHNLSALWEKPLIVVTSAMRQQALAYGFKSAIIVTNSASDQAIISALQQL